MRKYAVIYRSVLMENLQYAANIAMGFISYIVSFLSLYNFGIIYTKRPARSLPDIRKNR